MIQPGGIPQYTGDFAQLEKAASGLRTHALGIRTSGKDVHSRFQATAGYYKAPEADRLFSSTQPVMDTAEEFATDIESLADALDTFIHEAKPHADRLKQLKLDAIDFVHGVEGDDDWTEDPKKLDEHQALMDDVATAQDGFHEAERKAANVIEAISPAMSRPRWTADDGSHGPRAYGPSEDLLAGMKNLPWGSPEERTYERWSLGWWGHGAKSWAWDGLAKDSIWGGIDGLGTLVGFHGEDSRDEAWDGLRRTAVGGYAYGMDALGQGEHLSDWQRESEAYAKEFAKQLVAYDVTPEDPARGHAIVSFNLLTLFAGPLGVAAKLGKGGTFAKTAGTVARIGDALDPLGGAFKAAKALSDLPKVSQVLANVSDHLRIPASRFPDGALDLDHRYRIDKDGNFVPLDHEGNPHLEPARHEPTADRRGDAERQPVGVGAQAETSAAHMHENAAPHPAGEGTHAVHRDDAAHGRGDAPDGEGASGDGDTGRASDGGSGGSGGHLPTPHSPVPESGGPLIRGSETEQRIRDAVQSVPGRKRPKPNVLERVLERLASEPDGQRVADIIASGRFNQADEYGQVVSALGANKAHMFQPSADQLIFADKLVESGVPAHAIDFEQKVPVGADVDIRIRDESGDVYAYQMKHLNDPQDPVSEITRGKYLLQLAIADADHSVMLVDGGRGTVRDWMTNGSYDELLAIHSGARGRKGTGITFVIRLEDGNLVIPPGSRTDPKDML
ncbi:hypothetical protein [Streptomyces sp. CB02460]|uniref:hypothetical protein n=1 Tax=Streptomyces sp. CB02460 TaxID=1703941 RepID=UPI000939B7EA|nr:hypothetical protein [Streptomyces sp. CB02460]